MEGYVTYVGYEEKGLDRKAQLTWNTFMEHVQDTL